MFPHKILTAMAAIAMLAIAMTAVAYSQQPPVKVNVLNVCAPPADEQKELTVALAKVPSKPAFGKDYEVSRGHSTLDQSTPIPGMEKLPAGAISSADYVRVRREFPDNGNGIFSNVQYSFSVDSKDMVETLVLRVRDPKDLMQISVEDSASAVVSAASMLSTSTPVSRVKLERFGKASVVLARCPAAEGSTTDQTKYEPIFRDASAIMERYREALGVRKMVPQELAHSGVGTTNKAAAGSKKNR